MCVLMSSRFISLTTLRSSNLISAAHADGVVLIMALLLLLLIFKGLFIRLKDKTIDRKF